MGKIVKVLLEVADDDGISTDYDLVLRAFQDPDMTDSIAEALQRYDGDEHAYDVSYRGVEVQA